MTRRQEGRKSGTLEIRGHGRMVRIPYREVEAGRGLEFFVRTSTPYALSVGNRDGQSYERVRDLHDAVAAELARVLAVTWSPQLRVEMNTGGRSWHDENARDLRLSWDELETGVRTDGARFYRNPNSPTRVQEGEPNTGTDTDEGGSVELVAIVPDTEANRAALGAILAGMDQLAARLAGLLDQDQVQDTLAATATKLLPLLLEGTVKP